MISHIHVHEFYDDDVFSLFFILFMRLVQVIIFSLHKCMMML